MILPMLFSSSFKLPQEFSVTLADVAQFKNQRRVSSGITDISDGEQ